MRHKVAMVVLCPSLGMNDIEVHRDVLTVECQHSYVLILNSLPFST